MAFLRLLVEGICWGLLLCILSIGLAGLMLLSLVWSFERKEKNKRSWFQR
mgnify:CR=1 FL=1